MALQPGTAIATFDANGRYGNHTDGRSHAAIYIGQDKNGIRVIDQGIDRRHGNFHREAHERVIVFNNKNSTVDNGNMFYVVRKE